jgi:flagellar biosynthetic protein FliR
VLIAVDTSWILGALLISARLAALLLLSPLFSLARLPARISVLMILAFSVALNSVVQQYAALRIDSLDQLFIALVRELAVGALMAFGINCAFGAFSFGGRILDLQMGFGVANLVNPSSNEQSPLIGMVLLVVGVLTFFALNGHHWIARGVVQSFQWFPLAKPLGAISLAAIMQQFGLMFSLGFILVSPLVVVLLLLDVAMAIAARTMPQMNIFMLSMPIKIAVGLSMLAISAPHLKNLFQHVFESIFEYWAHLA